MKDSAIDSNTLTDVLVDVVDDIRREVHGALGTRTWEVAIVTRRWSGDRVGVGTPTKSVMVLDPNPLVRRNTRDRMGPAGREAAGSMTLTEVSLRYSQLELQPKADATTEIAYRLTEIHGQRMKPRWFVLSAEPVARRGDLPNDNSDWYLVLNETPAMSDDDGVDAP